MNTHKVNSVRIDVGPEGVREGVVRLGAGEWEARVLEIGIGTVSVAGSVEGLSDGSEVLVDSWGWKEVVDVSGETELAWHADGYVAAWALRRRGGKVEPVSAAPAAESGPYGVLSERIERYLAEHPGETTTPLQRRVRGSAPAIVRCLHELESAGRVRREVVQSTGSPKRWFLNA